MLVTIVPEEVVSDILLIQKMHVSLIASIHTLSTVTCRVVILHRSASSRAAV